MLGLWGIRSIPLLLSLPGSLWPRVVAPYRVPSLGQIELILFAQPLCSGGYDTRSVFYVECNIEFEFRVFLLLVAS